MSSGPEPSPREAFSALARRPDASIDLAEAALWIAAEEYPSLDVPAYLEQIEAMGNEARIAVGPGGDLVGRTRRLNSYFFQQQNFTGNRIEYEDPRNSFLNEVLERGTGLPITLSLLYVEVARRVELPAVGVGFPGHFLVRVGSVPGVVVDPFFGIELSGADCEARLRQVLGDDAAFEPDVHLRAATPREILVRLLSNLKVGYARAGDFERALGCCDRILLLLPDAPLELRDRGLVYEQLECHGAATADLERFLLLAPRDESAAAVRERVLSLRAQPQRLH